MVNTMKKFILQMITGWAIAVMIVPFIAYTLTGGVLADVKDKPVFCTLWGLSILWIILFMYSNIFWKGGRRPVPD